MKLYETETD